MILLTEEPQSQPRQPGRVPPQARPGRHYEHAPITEAIIEIRCELPSEVTLDDLAHVVDPAEFSLAGPSVEISGQIDVSEAGIKGGTSGKQIGHVFRRNDGRRLIQSRLNGFAYSALPPYEQWEDFSAEAWSYWLVYQRTVHPVRAVRLGLRYVNRIDIPQSSIEIKDYLRTAVDVSPYLPQMVAGYFLQVIIPLDDFDAAATIVSTVAPPPAPETTSLILDIDAWRDTDTSFELVEGNEEIRNQLETLRNAKNRVFEACITDATRGLIS